MAIKSYKPITPGQRKKSTLVNEEITKKTPEKSLVTIHFYHSQLVLNYDNQHQ